MDLYGSFLKWHVIMDKIVAQKTRFFYLEKRAAQFVDVVVGEQIFFMNA